MKKEFQLTRQGVEDLKSELEALAGSRREIAEKIKTAREFGDLSENAEYQGAMDEHQKTELRIKEIEYILKNVEVLDKPKNTTEIEVGNTVTLDGGEGTKTFTIVGSVEANPAESKISNESPIGKALLGKKVGDVVSVGKTDYKVAAIS